MMSGGERRRDRKETGCKLIAGLDTRIKKLYERNKLTIY
jgi:hypothetical protein